MRHVRAIHPCTHLDKSPWLFKKRLVPTPLEEMHGGVWQSLDDAVPHRGTGKRSRIDHARGG
jgi:hypothetical protein